MSSAYAPPSAHDSRTELPSSESRGERLVRQGHRLRLYALAALVVVLVAVGAVLVSANARAVKLDWAFGSTRVSLVWIITAAAVLGWLLGITTAVTFHHRTRRPG